MGKAAGTSFDLWREESKSLDAITFHHPASYFLERSLVRPHCIFGVTLREPVSLFWSQFIFCLGRKCLRKQHFECGFICCVPGSELHLGYELTSPTDVANRERLVALMVNEPETWHLGRNPSTRHLGQHADLFEPAARNGYDYTSDVVNTTSAAAAYGRAYLARAKARLELFDFVLIVEDLDAGYARQLGWPGGAPWHNVAGDRFAAQKKPPFPEKHRAAILGLNQLDVELYAFAVDLATRFNARGPLSRFADLSKGLVSEKTKEYRTCLNMRRAAAPIVGHANDRETAAIFSPPPGA